MNTFFYIMKWWIRGKESLKLPNGDIYVGDINHPSYIPKSWGTLTGTGMYRWVNGDLYEGSFVEGKCHGNGIIKFASGKIFKGSFSDGMFHGKGVLTFQDGDSFEGEWENGIQKQGGVLIIKNGDRFEGNWRDGKKACKGIYTSAAGYTIKGYFRNGEFNGTGTYTSKGKICENEFAGASSLSGKSIMKFDDGEYEGDVKELVRTGIKIMKITGRDGCEIILVARNGKGIYRFRNGSIYEGEFLNGKMNGKGILRFKGGTYYNGNWKDGMKNGEGEIKYNDGVIYKGSWKDNKWNGKGTLYFADGLFGSAEFENNRLIRFIDTGSVSDRKDNANKLLTDFLSSKSFNQFPGIEFSEN